jgi:hypothetical protein
MGMRLNEACIKLNIGAFTAIEFLNSNGFDDIHNINSKITEEQYEALCSKFKNDANLRSAAIKIMLKQKKEKAERITNAHNILPKSKHKKNPLPNVLPKLFTKTTKTKNLAYKHVSNTNIAKRKRKKLLNKKSFIKVVSTKLISISPKGICYQEKDNKYYCSIKISPNLNQYIEDFRLIFPMVKIKITKGCHFEFIDTDALVFFNKKNEILIERGKLNIKNNYEQYINPVYLSKQLCTIANIVFEDGFYMIYVLTSDGKPCMSIPPLKIQDSNSFQSYNILKKYFEQRFPKDMIIEYDYKHIVNVNNIIIIDSYIRILKDNILIKGEWTAALKNHQKKSLDWCRHQSETSVYNTAISRGNEYIDYLIGHQNDRNLIKVYEVTNFNQTEDCYLFSIDVDEFNEVIIFENVNFARATEVFLCNKNNYENAIGRIFNYFTNYELSNRRISMKLKDINSEDFHANSYVSIDHDNLCSWICKINMLSNITRMQGQHIKFIPGFVTTKIGNTRVLSKEELHVSHLHDLIKRKLYDNLVEQYGKNNVATETFIGKKRIDLVVKVGLSFDIYEIKTFDDSRKCLVQAIGQILDYAYFECKDNIRKKIIVGPVPITKEVQTYLKRLQDENDLLLDYLYVKV